MIYQPFTRAELHTLRMARGLFQREHANAGRHLGADADDGYGLGQFAEACDRAADAVFNVLNAAKHNLAADVGDIHESVRV